MNLDVVHLVHDYLALASRLGIRIAVFHFLRLMKVIQNHCPHGHSIASQTFRLVLDARNNQSDLS